jgi:hypothetical protein
VVNRISSIDLRMVRRDPVLRVECRLRRPTTFGLLDRACHAACHAVRVEDRGPVHVAGRPADRLDERGLGSQEALLVRVEDRHQRDFGQIEALPQKVDSDEHVEFAEPEVPQDLDPFDGVDVAVHVAHADAPGGEIIREILGHALREGRDQDPFAASGPHPDLLEQVVDLARDGPDLDLGIQQAGGPDQLLRHDSARASQLVGSGRRAQK